MQIENCQIGESRPSKKLGCNLPAGQKSSAPESQVTTMATMGEVSPPTTSPQAAARKEEESSAQDPKKPASNIDPQREALNTDRITQTQLDWQHKLSNMEESRAETEMKIEERIEKQEKMLATALDYRKTSIGSYSHYRKPPIKPYYHYQKYKFDSKEKS